MTVTVYTFTNREDNESGCYKTQDYREAEEYARRYGLKIVANEFEFSCSHVVEDFTGGTVPEGACQTCDGSGTDDEGTDCPDCQGREVCPWCGEPIEYVEPTPTNEAFRKCSAGCGWSLN